jgi:hypothetical protein
MGKDKNSKSNTYGPNKGIPTNTGNSKAEVKNVHGNKTDLQYKEELREKYEKDSDEPVDHLLENPNRSPNKPDIDNNKYN